MLINGSKVIETYIVISGFLLAVNFKVFAQKQKKFELKYFWHALFYRYFRFIPTIIFIILFNITTLVRLEDGPLWKFVTETERTFCRNNWWTNMLFINNYVHPDEPCIQQTWFLATDFQLTIVGLAIMMIIWKYPWLTRPIFIFGFICAFIMPGLIVYLKSFEGVMINGPE